jgi:hypothetical protein
MLATSDFVSSPYAKCSIPVVGMSSMKGNSAKDTKYKYMIKHCPCKSMFRYENTHHGLYLHLPRIANPQNTSSLKGSQPKALHITYQQSPIPRIPVLWKEISQRHYISPTSNCQFSKYHMNITNSQNIILSIANCQNTISLEANQPKALHMYD